MMVECNNLRLFPYAGRRIYHEILGGKDWLKHSAMRPLRQHLGHFSPMPSSENKKRRPNVFEIG
jgi:hypothetical protein